jgi:glucokinase
VAYVVKRARKGEATSLTKVKGGVANTRSDDLADAFRAGDKLATRAIERGAKYMAIGIATLANSVNPELVVLGGGLVEALGDPLVRLVEKNLRGQPMRAATDGLRVVACELGDDAGITGAALVGRRIGG